jgi:hypothetical protein
VYLSQCTIQGMNSDELNTSSHQQCTETGFIEMLFLCIHTTSITLVAACTIASSESFCVVVPVLSLASPSCIPLARLCLHGSRFAVLSCDVQSGSALLRV